MKKLLFLSMIIGAVLMQFSFTIQAQTQTVKSMADIQRTDSVFLVRYVDQMTDKEYIFPSQKIVLATSDRKTGFKLTAFIKPSFKFNDIMITAVGIGNCNENNELIILFENGEKITIKSWNDFNCEGESYFSPSFSDLEMLSKYPISKIRFTNGRSYDSYTGDMPQSDKRWFIQLLYALNNKLCSVTVNN